jgi:hypothetical protein
LHESIAGINADTERLGDALHDEGVPNQLLLPHCEEAWSQDCARNEMLLRVGPSHFLAMGPAEAGIRPTLNHVGVGGTFFQTLA